VSGVLDIVMLAIVAFLAGMMFLLLRWAGKTADQS
jgi:hypothetical protein